MKTRTVEEVNEIRGDLQDAETRLRDIRSRRTEFGNIYDDTIHMRLDTADLMMENYVSFYQNELEEATKHGVQLTLGF